MGGFDGVGGGQTIGLERGGGGGLAIARHYETPRLEAFDGGSEVGEVEIAMCEEEGGVT